MTSYLLPIADRQPLLWILAESRTAFAEHRRREAEALEVGDSLLLYTTRGCFRNPTRDRGRVIGRARVARPVRRVDEPVCFGEAIYPHLVELEIETLAPLRQGLELALLVPRLRKTFPDAGSWSARMRRALVPLDPADAWLIDDHLAPFVRPYATAIDTYKTLHASRR